MAEACQEQKYVTFGRFGEWHNCTHPAKFTITATKGGKGFKKGQKIKVCGVHKRSHEALVARQEEYDARERDADAAQERASKLERRLGSTVNAHYNHIASTYHPDLVVVSAKKLESLLEKAGL